MLIPTSSRSHPPPHMQKAKCKCKCKCKCQCRYQQSASASANANASADTSIGTGIDNIVVRLSSPLPSCTPSKLRPAQEHDEDHEQQPRDTEPALGNWGIGELGNWGIGELVSRHATAATTKRQHQNVKQQTKKQTVGEWLHLTGCAEFVQTEFQRRSKSAHVQGHSHSRVGINVRDRCEAKLEPTVQHSAVVNKHTSQSIPR